MANSEDRTFQPGSAETNRGREQGLGLGQRELDAQADPTGGEPEETRPTEIEAEADNPQEDWGEAIEDAAYGANHVDRGRPLPEDREHGPKTRQASKAEINRRA